MEYFNNILCISQVDLIRNDAGEDQPSDAIMSESNYKKLASGNHSREKINVVRPGKGLGCYALVEVASLPERFLQKVNAKYPNKGINMILRKWFDEHYYPDADARCHYSTFRFDNGKQIPPDKQTEYVINASVLNAVIDLFNDKKIMKRSMGGRIKWDEMTEAVTYYQEKYEHTLPENPARFKEKVLQYQSGGYNALISKKFRNQNTRKVSVKTEQLILSIAALPTNPFNNTVHDLYMQFVYGEIDICDPSTGELFNPDDFCDKEGKPIELSEATITNYLNQPKNKILLGNMRNSPWDFNNAYRPHHHRHSPFFSFSKISLDDRDLPRRTHNGVSVKAYYSYDVTSGCVIGYAYNRLKTKDLFIDCIRNMFRTIARNNWCMPAQAEVEHHLVNNYKDGLMKAGIVFPFVRWCNPGNSQEKRAEHGNRAKKYSVEKNNHVGIGRWYLKNEANRPKNEKIFDEENNNYKEKTYSFDELVADDIADINEFNNMLHPNQKLFPGMTRWNVLCENMNPELKPIDKALLYRYIGDKKQVTIYRSQYLHCCNLKFHLSSPEIMDMLEPNNFVVDAYYLPDENGDVDEVFIYQNDDYVDCCSLIDPYNEATFEQTSKDVESYTNQAKYISQFDKMVKDEKIQKVVIIKKEETEAINNVVAKIVDIDIPLAEIEEDIDYSQYMNPEYMKSLAQESL
nr:hypothetical protein [uncultured Bacteroides sp.]